jgi:argininosuccinate lyase
MVKKLWGGRFKKRTDPLVEKFTRSIQFDQKIVLEDVLGSLSHIDILRMSGYLTVKEFKKLESALSSIFYQILKGKFKPNLKSEDIHTDIQNVLQRKIGDLALKLHTARSRNDQVVFATKLYCKSKIGDLQEDITFLINTIANLAERNKHIIIPGFTHLQHAQPVYLKDYLGAYIEMLKRDDKRLGYISHNINVTMGAGALAGTPIDASLYALKASEYLKGLKKTGAVKTFNLQVTKNSLDCVSDRDFIIEIISALSIIAMHLSRLSEDLIIWSTREFDFIEIDESFCTGSSLMPQKKNPDVLELIRGYAGRLAGNLVSVLTMMKGLPLTYNRDMQLDKEPLFSSFEIVSNELQVLKGLVKTLRFNEPKIESDLKDESLYATDIVYYLVGKGVPFKEAHNIVGKLVRDQIDKPGGIKEMEEEELRKYSDKFEKNDIVKLFDPKKSVTDKKSIKRNRLRHRKHA